MIFILFVAVLCMPQLATAQSYREEGIASWYGTEFDGRPTASGEIFNSALFTAAHPTLPFGTFLKVTNRNNNRQITVKVNDRGPFAASRIIDLSKAAAEHLDMILAGVAPVIIETLPTGNLPPLEVHTPAVPAVVEPPPQPAPAPVAQPVPAPVTPPAAVPAPAPAAAPQVTTPPPPAPAAQPAADLAPMAPPIAETAPAAAAPAPSASAVASSPYGGPPITINVYQPPQAQSQSVQLPPTQTQVAPAPEPPPPPQPAYYPQYPYAQAPYSQPPAYPPASVAPPPLPPQQQPYPQEPSPPPSAAQPVLQPQIAPVQPPPIQAPPPAAEPAVEWKAGDTTITIEIPQPKPQPPAVKFIPSTPPAADKKYRIQIGSYKVPQNAVAAFDKLKAVGLNPAYEQHGELYRVVLGGIVGKDVESVAYKLDKAGFREVIIRQE